MRMFDIIRKKRDGEVLSGEEVTAQPAAMGLACATPEPLPHKKHIFSHVTWEMEGFFLPVQVIDNANLPTDWVWATYDEMEATYPIPSAHGFYREVCKEKDCL